MSWNLVQQVDNITYPSAAIPTLTTSQAVTKGNLLVAWIASSNNTASLIFIDDGLNAWIPLTTRVVAGYGRLDAWYCIAQRSTIITASFFQASASSSATQVDMDYPACQLMEFSGNGQLPVDAVNTATGNSNAPASSVTATSAADLILGLVVNTSGDSCTETTGWTNTVAPAQQNAAIYAIESAAGTFTPTYTQNGSGSWGVIAAAFRGPQTTYTISGSLGPLGKNSLIYFISNTTQAIYSASADGSGNYTSPGLENDTYTIIPQVIGVVFSPTITTSTISGANNTGVNFTSTAVPTILTLTTSVTDSMNRANENPLSDGGNWAVDGTPVPPYDPSCQILSNECVMADPTIYANFAGPWTGDGENVWVGSTLPDDQFMTIQSDALNPDFASHATAYCNVRCPNDYSYSYSLTIKNNGDGTCNLFLSIVNNAGVQPTNWFQNGQEIYGVWTYLNRAFVFGDKFTLSVVGSTLYIQHNGTLLGNYTDTGNSLTSGTVVIELTGKSVSDAAISNFSAGGASAAFAPSGSGGACAKSWGNFFSA